MTQSQKKFQLVGKSKKVPEDVTNLKEHLPNVKKIRYCFNFEGMFLACAKRHYFVLALRAIHRASIDVTNSALSFKFVYNMETNFGKP